MSCEHAPFAPPDDADSQEERAGIQPLTETERPLFYCCFCRTLLLPSRWPLLLACLHSCCYKCAEERATEEAAAVGDKAGGSSAAAAAEPSAGSADAVRRQIASYLAEQHDSVLVKRRLRSTASAWLVDMPPCDSCVSDAGYGSATPDTANRAYERCDACSLNLCTECRAWHDKFNSRHEVIALDRYESDTSSLDIRPQCMHHATATFALHHVGSATAPNVFCVSCERLRCADCRRSCLSKQHEFHDIPEQRQHEQQEPATEAEARGLAADARRAIDDRLQRLDELDLSGIAMKMRHQARESFKQAEDMLVHQKNAVLKELESVRRDAEDVADQLLQIEQQLRPEVELTQSYRNLLLSPTSDDACVLDQKAVVLSRLNSMLRSTDKAKELLGKAGTVIKAEPLQQPVNLLAKMIERLQELQQQQQQGAGSSQTAAAAPAAATADIPDCGAAVSGSPATAAILGAASAVSRKSNVVEISNEIAEEQASALPPATAVDASHPTAQRNTVAAGPVHSQQPSPPSTADESAAFYDSSTSSGDAAAHATGRKPASSTDRGPPEAVVQTSIDEGVLDKGGGFSDLCRQQLTQQQPQRLMQPTQQQQQPQRHLQQQPPQQQRPPQQQSPPQQQLPQQQPPQQQSPPQQQPPQQQQPHQQQWSPQQQPPPPEQQQQRQQQPAQPEQERQLQIGQQPQQPAEPEPEVYRATGRPTGSVRLMHDCRDVALAPNGHLLLAALKIGLIELDASGREVSRWTPPPTDEGQADTASTVEVLCDADDDNGRWRAVVGLMDSQSVVLLRRSNAAVGSNGDPALPRPWTLEGEPIMLRAAPIRLSVCQPGLLAVAGAQMSVTQESKQHGGKSKGHGSRNKDRGSSGLVMRRSWTPGPYLDAMQLTDGQSRLCETLGYCIQGVTVTPRIVAALSNDTQRTEDGRQRYVIDAFCLSTGRRLWRHGMDSEPSDICISPLQTDVVLYAAMQHAGRVVAVRARNGADAGELLSEQGNGVHVPIRIALAAIGLQTIIAVLTARNEVLLYPVS